MKQQKKLFTPADALENTIEADSPFAVVSTTECTGLVRSGPPTQAEAQAYGNLYDVPVTENKRQKK